MRSIDVDPWIALHRGAGCQGDWEDSDNDSGFGFEEALLEATLDRGGTWSFGASTAEPQATGDYMVGLAVAGTPEAASLRGEPRVIGLDGQVAGELSPADPARPRGRYFDCYEVTASGPVELALDVRSTAFKPTAHVYMDSSCRRGRYVELVVESSANEAVAAAFRAKGLLPSGGRYFIAVTSDGLRQTGDYLSDISATP